MRIAYLEKKEKTVVLPALYALMEENGTKIPGEVWLGEVGAALAKENRQILLFLGEGELLGFFMYYICGERLVAEELQIAKGFHRSGVYLAFCRFLAKEFPEVREIEAFTEKDNFYSQKILEKLGMKKTEERDFFRFFGEAEALRKRCIKNKDSL